ncbi:MAG: hypothetical protein LBF68_02170 [Christensenellaceae bacterium]|jgi:hypothetical protein|nr:hypothetical protein [Christensenellaceae bacterium]
MPHDGHKVGELLPIGQPHVGNENSEFFTQIGESNKNDFQRMLYTNEPLNSKNFKTERDFLEALERQKVYWEKYIRGARKKPMKMTLNEESEIEIGQSSKHILICFNVFYKILYFC